MCCSCFPCIKRLLGLFLFFPTPLVGLFLLWTLSFLGSSFLAALQSFSFSCGLVFFFFSPFLFRFVLCLFPLFGSSSRPFLLHFHHRFHSLASLAPSPTFGRLSLPLPFGWCVFHVFLIFSRFSRTFLLMCHVRRNCVFSFVSSCCSSAAVFCPFPFYGLLASCLLLLFLYFCHYLHYSGSILSFSFPFHSSSVGLLCHIFQPYP